MNDKNIKYWLRFITVIIPMIVIVSNTNAQEVVGTENGTIQITGILNDTSSIVAISNKLMVILNYETAQIEIILDKSTLRTGVDSLDEKLKKLEREVIIYKGKLGIEYIQTEKHPPQDFVVEGYLNSSLNSENIAGKGHLEHIFGNFYSCILNMSFHLKPSEFNLNIDLQGLTDEIHIEILQTVLKK